MKVAQFTLRSFSIHQKYTGFKAAITKIMKTRYLCFSIWMQTDIARSHVGWIEWSPEISILLPDGGRRVSPQRRSTRLFAPLSLGQRIVSRPERRRLFIGMITNDRTNIQHYWLRFGIRYFQVINDLSALLEDANTSVSNSLTFAPDELTDTLEILQVRELTLHTNLMAFHSIKSNAPNGADISDWPKHYNNR